MRRRSALLLLVALSGCGDDSVPSPAAAHPTGPCAVTPDELAVPPIHTPRWAFDPWISKDISDAADTRAFVEGFESRGIPAGVVVLDSPWETNYTTFVPNPSRYPGFDGLVEELHASGRRIVLWTTQMVNTSSFDFEAGGDVYDGPSPNFDEGSRCGFFVNDGETYGWWKGVGAGLDFFDPSAAAWWHRQQDPLFDVGVDGFKLDFGENYVRTDPVRTADGDVTHQAYSERYYQDFLAYGVSWDPLESTCRHASLSIL